jgi:hypothetical protein
MGRSDTDLMFVMYCNRSRCSRFEGRNSLDRSNPAFSLKHIRKVGEQLQVENQTQPELIASCLKCDEKLALVPQPARKTIIIDRRQVRTDFEWGCRDFYEGLIGFGSEDFVARSHALAMR